MLLRTLFTHVSRHAIGYIALFVALGGSAYAATSIVPVNSVGPAQLRKGAVTLPKIAAKARTALHTIPDHAVTPRTIGVIPAARVTNGSATTALNGTQH
jgi:hypothetical protein